MITPSISTPIDVNTPIYFTVPAGYYSYVWGGSATGSTNQSNTVSFTTPGTYTVTVFICSDSTETCCGLYVYTFNVVNDCVGVSISTSSSSCTNITATVTGGTGTRTYKVDGPYGSSIPVTALPGGGVFTIDTSSFPAGATGSITITVYVNDGSEICSTTTTVNYTRCSCQCISSQCQTQYDYDGTDGEGLIITTLPYSAGKILEFISNSATDVVSVTDRFKVVVENGGSTTILDTGYPYVYNYGGCPDTNSLPLLDVSPYLVGNQLPSSAFTSISLPAPYGPVTLINKSTIKLQMIYTTNAGDVIKVYHNDPACDEQLGWQFRISCLN